MDTARFRFPDTASLRAARLLRQASTRRSILPIGAAGWLSVNSLFVPHLHLTTLEPWIPPGTTVNLLGLL